MQKILRSLRYGLLLPPENFRLMMSRNRYSGRHDERGAAVYLTGCVNANSTSLTNLDISIRDVKKKQGFAVKNCIHGDADSQKRQRRNHLFSRFEFHSIRKMGGVSIRARSASSALTTPRPFSHTMRSFVQGSALVKGGLSPIPRPCLPCS